MSDQQHQTASSQNNHLPWWIRLCRWLWMASGFLGISVFLALGINVASTWLTTPKGILPADTPLSALMTNWPISLLVGCCLLLLALFFWAISRWSVPSNTTTATITPQDRERMLGRLRIRYEQLLSQSLQGAVQIELGLASRPAAIHNAVSLSLRLPEQSEQMLPPHTSIIDGYKQAQQELLILGEPGAGKSTLLLELAQHLVEQAEQDKVQPLPVLVPLSSWAVKRSALQDWLIEQFALLYNVPRHLSQDWVRADLILPLLDGLDEMDEAARVACISAINTYHREHLYPLVVCSRTNEYDAATVHEQLALHTAIVVQPLTSEQVDAYLTTFTMVDKSFAILRTALQKNPTLAHLATTPLMLQILLLTYHGTEMWQLPRKQVVLQQQVWKDYVQQMINRKGDVRRYPLPITTTWLSFLARQMRAHNQPIFLLEQLQPDWLLKKRGNFYRWSVRLVGGLVSGLIGGLLIGLVGGLLFGLVSGLVGGLLIGLVNGLRGGSLIGLFCGALFGLVGGLISGLDTKIKPTEVLIWSWEKLRSNLVIVLLFGLLFGLFAGVLYGMLYGMLFGLFAWVLLGTFIGFSSKELTERLMLSPNEGMRRSAKNGLLIILLSVLFFGSFVGPLVGSFAESHIKIGGPLNARLIIRPFLGVLVGGIFGPSIGGIFGLSIGGIFGLLAVVQHYTLRFWLWRSHLFPLKAVPFLEDATDRILLRRVGGGYEFTHGLLRDYFADLETTPATHLVNDLSPKVPPTPQPLS